jgi:hypothetical protein
MGLLLFGLIGFGFYHATYMGGDNHMINTSQIPLASVGDTILQSASQKANELREEQITRVAETKDELLDTSVADIIEIGESVLRDSMNSSLVVGGLEKQAGDTVIPSSDVGEVRSVESSQENSLSEVDITKEMIRIYEESPEVWQQILEQLGTSTDDTLAAMCREYLE